MILVLRPDASLEQIDHVIERVKELGFQPHVSRGESRTIVGAIGDETKPFAQNFAAIPGVEQVLPILKPFKLASREFRPEPSAFVPAGGDEIASFDFHGHGAELVLCVNGPRQRSFKP